MSSITTPSITPALENFDPFSQNITFILEDGSTFITVPLQDLDHLVYSNNRDSILYGAQLGACLAFFLATFFLTKKKQRTHAVFWFNIASLIFGFLRALFLALYNQSPWVEVYSFFSNDVSKITQHDYAMSYVGTVFPLLMTITVNISLVLQVRAVVTGLMPRKYASTITFLAVTVLLLAVGFRFWEMVTNCKAIASDYLYFGGIKVQNGTLAMEAASIFYFMLVFCGVLFQFWWNHDRMKLTTVNKFTWLLIGGSVTMVVPAFFAIAQLALHKKFPNFGTLTLTTTACLLPLTTLWSSVNTSQALETFSAASSRLQAYPMLPWQRRKNSKQSDPGCGGCSQHCPNEGSSRAITPNQDNPFCDYCPRHCPREGSLRAVTSNQGNAPVAQQVDDLERSMGMYGVSEEKSCKRGGYSRPGSNGSNSKSSALINVTDAPADDERGIRVDRFYGVKSGEGSEEV